MQILDKHSKSILYINMYPKGQNDREDPFMQLNGEETLDLSEISIRSFTLWYWVDYAFYA